MSYEEEIENLRKEIDRLNIEIVEKIAERVDITLKIGKVKQNHGQPIVDKDREAKVLKQVNELASELDVAPGGIERVFKEIISLCTEAELEDAQ